MSDMCDDNRFELIEKYKKELIEATNIETAPDEMAVLDDILYRFWQMGWLDKLELPPAQPEYLHVIMEKIRKNYEKAMNVSYINDPMAVALSETWKEYVDEKEHKRG